MFDAIGYVRELLQTRGVQPTSIEYRTHVLEENDYYLEINAYNGYVFFLNPIQLPVDTVISGDANRIIIKEQINGTTAPDRIEEFSGQVIVVLPTNPENNTIIQYLQVYIK